MKNEIYIRRRNKVLLPTVEFSGTTGREYGITVSKNIESLGYTLSTEVIDALQYLSVNQITEFYDELVSILKKLKGAHVIHKPMYKNFPKEIMEMSEAELYINAIVHYLTDGKLLPLKEKKVRFPLIGNYELTELDLGTEKEFESLFGQIVSSNTSLSVQDKEDVEWYVKEYGRIISRILPDNIPQKETIAFLTPLMMKYTGETSPFLGKYCKTATDVLRIAVGLSGGDVSLATNSKFKSFTRRERRLLIGTLIDMHNPSEDIARHQEKWKRLAHSLHVNEYLKPKTELYNTFSLLRSNSLSGVTFNSKVECALQNDVEESLYLLKNRPGEFARRLDHLLRSRKNNGTRNEIITSFNDVSDKVSTPVLLQVREHFISRNDDSDSRVFFPKGSVAKAYLIENNLGDIGRVYCDMVANACESALIRRFSKLPKLGKTYIDPKLDNYLIPFSQRSASKALKTIVRGSKIDLTYKDTLRFFIWWKNGVERTDIDLSASLLNEDYSLHSSISYYNLRDVGGCHSGDIVDAPFGASEFIDISREAVLRTGARFVVMTINSFSQQPFCELPECFAGWMERDYPESGEIYEPKTVQNKVDITSDTQFSVPLVIDVLNNKVIWTDLALKNNPRFCNNVANNARGLSLTVKGIVEMRKPKLGALLRIHAKARGTLVNSPNNKCDTRFTVEDGIQYRLEEIASEYMASTSPV